jgi:uncharacterized membrane protein YoaT (DUF817 family)
MQRLPFTQKTKYYYKNEWQHRHVQYNRRVNACSQLTNYYLGIYNQLVIDHYSQDKQWILVPLEKMIYWLCWPWFLPIKLVRYLTSSWRLLSLAFMSYWPCYVQDIMVYLLWVNFTLFHFLYLIIFPTIDPWLEIQNLHLYCIAY